MVIFHSGLPVRELNRRRAVKLDEKKENEGPRASIWRRIQVFFLVPMVIFLYNVMSTFTFLALFSYVLLQGLDTATPAPLEYVIFAWFISMCMEMLRQIHREDAKTRLQRCKLWISNFWNVIDIAKTIIFFIGCVLRVCPGHRTLSWGRLLFAVSLIIFYMRLLHVFSANKHLGPKLIMIQKMFADLVVFLCILLVFLVGYGVSSEAVLHPGHSNATHTQILRRVFYRPYIQMFGESLEFEKNFGCDDELDDCAEDGWFGAILLVIYLFLSNVLLLNLLIAMFNYTFTRVQENTDVYWKYQRYKLIREYYKRPPLPPPFIIINHLLLLARGLTRRLILACKQCKKSSYCTCCRERNVFDPDLPPLTQASLDELTTWEYVKGEDYLAHAREREQRDANKRMKNTDRRINELAESVGKLVGDMSLINEKLESLQSLLIEKLGPPKVDTDDEFQHVPDAPTLSLYEKAASGRKSPRLTFQRAVTESLSAVKEETVPTSNDDEKQTATPNGNAKPDGNIDS